MSKQRLLITGASGFTGRHACEHFKHVGFEVIGVARHSAMLPNNAIAKSCDLTNYEAVRRLVQETAPHYLLHLAGQNHVGQSWQEPISSLEANMMSTAYLLEAIRQEQLPCKAVIVGSALQISLDDFTVFPHPYSLSKTLQVLIAQSWASLYDMPIVIAKPSNLIGPGFSNGVCSIFARSIAEMERAPLQSVLHVSNAAAKRDFLDVRDAVRAYEILLRDGKHGETYDICSGNHRSLREILAMLRQLTAVDFTVQQEHDASLDQPTITIPTKLLALGWQQSIAIETSLQDILHFYRQQISLA